MTDDFDGGWDNRLVLVEVAGGRWVERTPRFPDREPQLRREAALLPWLAPQLPVPVPLSDGGPAYVESGLQEAVRRLEVATGRC